VRPVRFTKDNTKGTPMKYILILALLTGCKCFNPQSEGLILTDISQVEQDLMNAELESLETTKTTKETKSRKAVPLKAEK
jgi:hypothetical protein